MTDASTARPVLSDRYELHRRIARGGMADVFLARDQLLDRPVAIKVLFPQYAAEPTFVARFRREAQSAANLNHQSVVAVYDWGAHEDTYFIVMEYVEGRSLADVLAAEGHLHPDRAAEITTDVASALGFAHRHGTVHRDVKPGNIMITPQGQVKVTDFGIARALAGNDDELTQTGSVMGTASYFSPEQAQGKQVDPRSDLYSLGVVLFEMVTGAPPFSGASPVSIAYKHVQEPAPVASAINPSVPPQLDAIINRLLAKNPDDRYPSAEEVRTDLRRFREGDPRAGSGQANAYPPPIGRNPPSNGAPTTAMARSREPEPSGRTEALPAPMHSRAPGSPGGPGGPPTGGHGALPPSGPPQHRPPDTGSSRAIIDTTRAIPASAAVRQSEPVEEYYEPPSRTGIFVVLLAGLLLLLVGLIVYISGNISDDTETEEPEVALVPVPTVVGDTQTTASNRLTDAGFEVDVQYAENDQFEANIVFDQDPEEGSEAEEGSVVTIFVVQAAETVPVPQVIGLTEEEARELLSGQGFTIQIEREQSDEIELDRVIRQSLEPGQEVNMGADITLTISSGPSQETIPNLQGQSANDASSTLVGLGFAPPEQIREPNNEVAENMVIRTDPPAGSTIDVSTPIKLYVSSGDNGQKTVPHVVGQNRGIAEGRLLQEGFRVRVEEQDVGDASQDGMVLSQSPESGSFLDEGDEVTIRVGRHRQTTTTPQETTTNTQNQTTQTTETTQTSETTAGGDG